MNIIDITQKGMFDNPTNTREENKIVIQEPWSLFKNKFISFLCHVHLSSKINDKVNLPFKFIWYKRLIKNNFKDKTCIIINSHFFALGNKHFINFLHRKKYKVVFSFSDKYEYFKKNYKHFPSIEFIKKYYDLVITYNVNDSKEYDLILSRPLIGNYSKILNDDDIQLSDIFFVGQNKGRLKLIHEIYDYCLKSGLKCDFHVIGVGDNEIKLDGIEYNKPIPYSEVLKRVKRTKCVVNLVQENGSGITLRDYEAMGNDKLLLTNNYSIKETDFYNSNQIIWLEDYKGRIDDIKHGYNGHNDFSNIYGEEKWINWLESLLKENEK